MRSKKNKLLIFIIIVWGIAASFSSVYLWQSNRKLEKINTLLLESLISANDLVKNASNAYTVFGECVTNQNTCNIKEAGKRLQQLNEEKEEINQTISEIQSKLQESK